VPLGAGPTDEQIAGADGPQGGTEPGFVASPNSAILSGAGSLALSVGGALAVGALLMVAVGSHPVTAYAALASGALGSSYALTETVVRATPLLFAGLAVLVSFRCGIWNIGAEGQMLMASLAVIWAGPALAGLPLWVGWAAALALGAAVGAGWSLLAGALRLYRGVPEVISTLMLNLIAYQLVSWAVNGPLIEAARSQPVSNPLPQALWLPSLGGTTRLHLGVGLPWILVGLVAFALARTAFGFRLRAVGAGERAARACGVPVGGVVLSTFALSGALAGLAPVTDLLGLYPHRLSEGLLSGVGYQGIPVALLGGLSPWGCAVSALFFGGLASGSDAMEQMAGVSSVSVKVLQAVLVFFLVARPGVGALRQLAKGRGGPSALVGEGDE
jgi:simple sugar transport system permease protein